MKVTTVLKGIISFVAAAFLILQLLLVGSAALIRPTYEDNLTAIGPPPGFSVDFNVNNQGLFAIQGFTINARVYNSSGTYLEGVLGPMTINALSTTPITLELLLINPLDILEIDTYTLEATISGYFLFSLISFTFNFNQTIPIGP